MKTLILNNQGKNPDLGRTKNPEFRIKSDPQTPLAFRKNMISEIISDYERDTFSTSYFGKSESGTSKSKDFGKIRKVDSYSLEILDDPENSPTFPCFDRKMAPSRDF